MQPGGQQLGKRQRRRAGDNIIISEWSTTPTLCRGRCCVARVGAELRVIP
ncbi:hypothetical protein LNP25_27015 [Klebsiella variicola subsp. variicola]|nr:hypothetical protein [Klebsiella variicola subsp. variicola]